MRISRNKLATAVLAVLLVAAGCGGSGQTPPPTIGPAATSPAAMPSTVTVSEASALRDQGAFILDVREPGEWAAGHIPGATLIPLGELSGRVEEVPTDKAVVVVCHSGNRSAQGRDILRQAGHANVTSMAGGMTDWQAAGLPVVTGS